MENKAIAIFGQKFVPIVAQYINSAKSTIDIVIFDWRWYPDDIGSLLQTFNQSLVLASRRGVRVRAIVNSIALQKQISQTGIDVVVYSGTKTLHSKFIVIDNKIVICGSHNFTQSGFSANHETSLLVEDEDISHQFNNFFRELWTLPR